MRSPPLPLLPCCPRALPTSTIVLFLPACSVTCCSVWAQMGSHLHREAFPAAQAPSGAFSLYPALFIALTANICCLVCCVLSITCWILYVVYIIVSLAPHNTSCTQWTLFICWQIEWMNNWGTLGNLHVTRTFSLLEVDVPQGRGVRGFAKDESAFSGKDSKTRDL